MQSFTHLGNAKLIFGNGKIAQLPGLVAAYGSVLILTGRHFVTTAIWSELQRQFAAAGILVHHQLVTDEPTPEVIDTLTQFAKQQQVTAVIAIGGGSVLDAGKAVAAIVCHQGSVMDYLEGVGSRTPTAATLPLIAVPTTAGTGSEATKNAVIGQKGERAFKKSLRHDAYIPPIALIDPQLSVGTPASITLACAMDAFCQLLESFVSTTATPISDALALQGIQLFAKGSRLFREDLYGTDEEPELRGQLALAAYLSGLSLANAGLGTVHGLAGPLGAACNIPHGAACGLLLAPVFGRLLDKAPLEKFSQARAILFPQGMSDLEAIEQFSQWAAPLGRLSHHGLSADKIATVVSQANNKNSPITLDEGEMKQLLAQLL
ncbi:iron-containing alcohol dehydrogenase [Shewanella sp. AS1]|uniref:iron-containing alcohol dehydrogenase n=1 Tax=Shewanella sp. AS1 TaxID=2907626 RepID=UPI001F309431|nr:iron-containing alcohol dehydrogenase [Shewanella sp. AS1]MCE9680094.1 iron-containing alcohol dehydrogenase [Shewanella sp. AS1]